MSNYTGFPCPVCDKPFLDGDDVVVCPDCGAPYHRGCYQKVGHCLQDELHATGEQWRPPVSASPDPAASSVAEGSLTCPRCGASNPAGTLLCRECGWRLAAPAQGGPAAPSRNGPGAAPGNGPQGGPASGNPFSGGFQGPGQGVPPFPGAPQTFDQFFQQEINFGDELADGVTYQEMAEFVGPNALKFLMKFRLMRRGAAVTFNWSAFFFSFFYCFYRKMYKLGTILLAILAAAFIPALIFTSIYLVQVMQVYGLETLTTMAIPKIEGQAYDNYVLFSTIFSWVRTFVSLGAGALFNKFYLKEAVRRIHAVREKGRCSTGTSEYSYALARSGGVTMAPVAALTAGYFVLCFLCVFIIML